MVARPVVDEIAVAVIVDGARHGAHHQRREKRILERQAQAGHAIAEAIERGGVFHVRECEPAIELVHAGFEDAAHREALHARHESRPAWRCPRAP